MTSAPQSICILRLSALGDVVHTLALVRHLQASFPDCKITWVIGKFEARLLGDIMGIELITVDKKLGWRALPVLWRTLRGRRFDVLLHCQVAMRANLLSLAIRAKRRIGFDKARSRDAHGLFVNERIPAGDQQHSMMAIGSFALPLGLSLPPPVWNLPISDAAKPFADYILPGDQATLLISPCASHTLRNWHAAGYAAVADYAVEKLGMRVLLCGGPSQLEKQMGDEIVSRMKNSAINMIGKDTLQQLLAMIARAQIVLSPDSGPMHIANALGVPVVGLHAASNSLRSGPFSFARYCVDKYDAAARKFRAKSASELRWGQKIEFAGAMDLITVDEVIAAVQRCRQDTIK